LPIRLPGVWDTLGIVGEGTCWFRKEIELTESDCKENLVLSIGQVNNRAEVCYLKGFEIAGIDKKFYWAKAEIIDNNHVSVYNAIVMRPMYVRYAWEDNPEVNLVNVEGLPAPAFNMTAKE